MQTNTNWCQNHCICTSLRVSSAKEDNRPDVNDGGGAEEQMYVKNMASVFASADKKTGMDPELTRLPLFW